MNKKLILLSLLIITNYPSSLLAQTQPRINTPNLEPPPDLQPLPPLEETLPKPQTTTPQISPLEDMPIEITVTEFNVIGSTIFSQEKLAEILQPYTNKPITFAQLVQASQIITKLYQDDGYITSGAFIPSQTIQDDVITIQVIEGKVESIEIQGLTHLQQSYIRSRLKLATDSPLNQEKLLQALQLLRINPLISNISAELTTGSQFGNNILKVSVTEANAFHLLASYDNYRNPSVGNNRILGQLTHDNLLGWGDRLNLTYYHTDGNDSIDDLSYTLPINPKNGTLSFRFSLSDSQVIEPASFKRFDLESEYRKYELTYRQPVIQTPNQEFAVGITADWQQSNNFLSGNPFPLSRGADEEGKTRIFALRLFQEYNNHNEREVFIARSQFNLGFDAFDATNHNDGRLDSQFFAWQGQTQYLNLINPDLIFLFRSNLQFANKALLSVEQFSMGGVYSVRGYSQDALLADNGLFASAELSANILTIPSWNTTLQLSPFIDFGTVWNSDEFPLSRNSLYSAGIGLRLLVDDIFSVRLDWGIPLADFNDDNDILQSDGLYFSFELKPF